MIVFGLGNPGQQYARTRHNVGFMVVDLLAQKLKLRFQRFPGYEKAAGRRRRLILSLVKPTVFMNNSGEAVKRVVRRSKSDFLVVSDDANLPLGRLRIRSRGSDGGHNGLASIIYQLQTEEFNRLRVGIGPTPAGIDRVDFVLLPFLAEELPVMNETIVKAADAVLYLVENGVEAAMNKFNE